MNTGLDGLASHVMSKKDVLKIQSVWATSARRLMKGEAFGKKVEEDVLSYNAMSNLDVLAFWGLASVERATYCQA